MIQKCLKVADLVAHYEMLSNEITSLNKEQERLGEKIIKKAQAAMAAEPAKEETKTA